MNPQQDSPIKLILDVPEKEVIFGFDAYASVLASSIMGTEPHFTIGIFGKWGSGKTTLLRKVEDILRLSYPSKVVPIFFDAWRYQREEHMLLPIMDTISQSLRLKRTSWAKTLNSKFKRAAKSIAVASTINLSLVSFEPKKAIEELQSDEKARSDYYSWLTELKKALNEARGDDPDRRIVLMIDDLDRCLPHKLVEVLESMKVMLDTEGIIFVMALDRLVAEKAVESHYGTDYNINGKDYLKKLIQVEFNLPPLRPKDVVKYAELLQERIGQIDSLASQTLAQVVPMIGDNPREVKRFMNNVLVTTSVMKRVGVTVPIDHQIAFMAMESKWPGVGDLVKSELVWNRVKLYIDAGKEERQELTTKKVFSHVKKIMGNNEGLEKYLKQPFGKGLMELDRERLDELLYYTAMTREKTEAEMGEDEIDDVLSHLTPRERRVIQLRFGLEDGRSRTMEEVAQEFSVTGEQIRQIEAKALRKLRHPSRSRRLKVLLQSLLGLSEPSQKFLIALFGDLSDREAIGLNMD